MIHFDSVRHYNIKNLNIFDPKFQLINTKPVIKNKLAGSLSELKILNSREF